MNPIRPKTIETILRDKIATGYDPVVLSVSPRGINSENLEVAIEGIKYIVKGNELLSLVDVEPASAAAEVIAAVHGVKLENTVDGTVGLGDLLEAAEEVGAAVHLVTEGVESGSELVEESQKQEESAA